MNPSSEHEIARWKDGKLYQTHDSLAEEVPIALVYNGISHAVMMATPQDLDDFALGFSLTEGILQSKSDLYDVVVVEHNNGVEIHLTIATECFEYLKERRRSMTGRTGCGLCGAENLAQAMRLPKIVQNLVPALTEKVTWQSVEQARRELQETQLLQKLTGATHACGWVNLTGQLILVREDVGRHNALDKLIGALAKSPPKQTGFMLTTSRASYEMVQKALSAGVKLLAAVSAPTALAVNIAEQNGVTLLGFVRENQHVAYTHVDCMKY